MQPIHELLNRIRWDPELGKDDFELGVYDRVEDKVVRLSFREVLFVPGDRTVFWYTDEEGEQHCVPLHRIKAVYKHGELIWHREH